MTKKKRSRVKRTSTAKKNSPLGLTVPTKDEHDAAVTAMEPFLDEVQGAIDEQTKQDFGVPIKRAYTPRELRKKLRGEK